MQTATYRVRLAAFSSVVLALLIVVGTPTSAAQKAEPLTEQKVFELLRAKVPSSRVSAIVDDRGIDFDLTADIEQRVRAAGGGDDLVAALRRASQHHAESEGPRTGGLVIKSTPGETQVYLNDEPKGMTSPKGEIRLPDLQPGSYNLRVSLPGYQSFEKNMTVEAGAAQTVYITLVQKSSVTPPKDNPSQPPAVATPGIPIPGVKVGTVQFFEGPHDVTLDKSQRVYRYSFDRSSARSIFWELDLTYPAPGRRVDFKIDAIWYKGDGSELDRQSFAAHVNPDWKDSYHTFGYGYADPGHWPAGSYRVDLYYQNMQIGSGTFQIN
ncbi:MAG: PEGA domain-containing protein [Terriglobia bacterium]